MDRLTGEFSRRDIPSMTPKVIENGVTVPPGLRTNCMTLRGHQDYCAFQGKRLLTMTEALAVGHRSDEIEAWFNPTRAVKETT